MRRIWILIALVCFMFAGARVSLGINPEVQREYQKQSETKLKDFQQKLDELKNKASGLKDNAKTEFDKQTREFDRKFHGANQKLKQLESESSKTASKTWDKLKADMDTAMNELDKLYDKIKSHFETK